MKRPSPKTRPLALDALLKIPANFYVVTEWTPLATDKARKEVNKRRRHFKYVEDRVCLPDGKRRYEDEPA